MALRVMAILGPVTRPMPPEIDARWTAPEGSWATSEATRRTMLHNRGRDTKPELRLRSEVHRRGLRYLVNRRPVREIRRTADLVFTRARVAVFVDGCFWHGCPEHATMPTRNRDFWEPKLTGTIVRDRETDRLLGEQGWNVIRIWEHELVAEAATRVELAVAARRGKAVPSELTHTPDPLSGG